MKGPGLESPGISILSDVFLAEVREIDKKNCMFDFVALSADDDTATAGGRHTNGGVGAA
jgi:hypothetical protein